jgi:ATP-dependent Clp protease ATP-binding subunit ClpA
VFERFTKKARRTVEEARKEANARGDMAVDSQHILLGLCRVEDSVAAGVLAESGLTYEIVQRAVSEQAGAGVSADALATIGIDLGAVRDAVEESFGPGAFERVARGKRAKLSGPPFTPRAKKVLELSLREAIALHHNYIGTEHILLALVRDGSGVGGTVLRELTGGSDVRRLVLERLRAAS